METDGIKLVDLLPYVSSFLLAGLAALGYLYRNERERRREIERQLDTLRRDAYMNVIALFFDVMKNVKSERKGQERKVIDRMIDANKDKMVFASDEVMAVYHAWLMDTRKGTVDWEQFAHLIVAIRRDIGYSDTAVTGEHVLRDRRLVPWAVLEPQQLSIELRERTRIGAIKDYLSERGASRTSLHHATSEHRLA